MVTVQIMGRTLQDAVGENELDVAVTEPTTVKKLIEANHAQLGSILPFLANREALITINKRIGTEDSAVKDGDVVKIAFQSRASYDGTRDIPT